MKAPDDLREPPAHRCAFCDRVVGADEHRFDETAGWVPLRRPGSPDRRLRLARVTGRVCCTDCMLRLEGGVDPRAQGNLFGG